MFGEILGFEVLGIVVLGSVVGTVVGTLTIEGLLLRELGLPLIIAPALEECFMAGVIFMMASDFLAWGITVAWPGGLGAGREMTLRVGLVRTD